MTTVDDMPYGEPVVGFCPVCGSSQQLSKHALRGADIPLGPVELGLPRQIIGVRFRCAKCDTLLAHQGFFGRVGRLLLVSALFLILGFAAWVAERLLSEAIREAIDGELAVLLALIALAGVAIVIFGAGALFLARAMRRAFGGAYLVTRRDGGVLL